MMIILKKFEYSRMYDLHNTLFNEKTTSNTAHNALSTVQNTLYTVQNTCYTALCSVAVAKPE